MLSFTNIETFWFNRLSVYVFDTDTMDYFEIDFEKLFNKTFFDQLTEERFEFYWVITGLQYIFVFAFTLIAIAGFSIYLWYLNKLFVEQPLWRHGSGWNLHLFNRVL